MSLTTDHLEDRIVELGRAMRNIEDAHNDVIEWHTEKLAELEEALTKTAEGLVEVWSRVDALIRAINAEEKENMERAAVEGWDER